MSRHSIHSIFGVQYTLTSPPKKNTHDDDDDDDRGESSIDVRCNPNNQIIIAINCNKCANDAQNQWINQWKMITNQAIYDLCNEKKALWALCLQKQSTNHM